MIDELRRWLDEERTRRAEALFRSYVSSGKVEFHLRLAVRLNWRMRFETQTSQPEDARQLLGQHGGPLQRSLIAPMYEDDFNSDERAVAVYLDGDEAVSWWRRNVPRSQYALQGWQRDKIYPDFVIAFNPVNNITRVAVVETKGDQLAGNLDTKYKRAVLALLSECCASDRTTPAGMLELINDQSQVSVECELILMSEWRTRLPALLWTDREQPREAVARAVNSKPGHQEGLAQEPART